MPRYCTICDSELTSDDFEGYTINGDPLFDCPECNKIVIGEFP